VDDRKAMMMARDFAGVRDPSWSPPPAPEDLDPRRLAAGFAKSDWPSWLTGTGGFEIGSRWRLTKNARVVVPRMRPVPTLALEGWLPVPDRRSEAATRPNARAAMAACNEKHKIVRRVPSEKEVGAWVARANTLPKIVEH